MEKSALEQEIAALRKDVERLREHQVKPELNVENNSPFTLDENVKKTFTQCVAQIKKDYENLSPATAVVLFALGTLFGRTLARHKGER